MVPDYVKQLINYAKKAIYCKLKGEDFIPKNIPDKLKEKKGIFTTLTINNKLRGCMGIINPIPLWKGVIKTAIMSAFEDPRFPSITKEEFKKSDIEVSLLSMPEKTTYAKIRKGDGVIIKKGFRSALFLPQVWKELPDKKSFIKHLFLKAGINPSEKVSYEKFKVKAWKLSNGVIKPVSP